MDTEEKMKKKIVRMLCSLVVMLSLTISTWVEVEASDNMPMLDGSYLTRETESTGTAVLITRGEDLQTGYSKLVKLGPGLIYAGGVTIAQHTVESVQVSVSVERALDEDDDWVVVTSWHAENNNADAVNSNRRIEVEGGYYYRVVCTHSAGNDMSDSLTDGIYVEAP